ncbi:MAG TPA: amidohydrolase family protein [Acidimicrobiales bacterium]|nr:amidohydrolase family protein [Acidimicrobiales bacterium]
MAEAAVARLFDADNHYWETSEAFTRHRNPAFKERGLEVREVDGVMRYVVNGEVFAFLPGPADYHPRPLPGAFMDYFKGATSREVFVSKMTEPLAAHPEWTDRDARLKVMDEQGVEGTWMFPSQGVVLEPSLHADLEAAVETVRAFNRWIEEEWGFAYRERIFGVPFLTLSDPDEAVKELEWCIEHGAHLVCVRHGAAVTRDGMRSPVDPMFDRFWGLLQESGVVLTPHDGADATYARLGTFLADAWGDSHMGELRRGNTDHMGQMGTFSGLLKNRIVHDFAYVLTAHGLFERFPKVRVAFIEFGCAWVPPLLEALEYLGHGGQFGSNPKDQFIEHCWVAPFVEQDVAEFARHYPVERILFGSDWPHGEGFPEPKDFLDNVASFALDDQRRIMYENAHELTFG